MLLCCFKPCASFHSHQWIQARVTVRTCQIWIKIDAFRLVWQVEILQMILKNNRAPVLRYFKFLLHFVAIGENKLELQLGNDKFWSKSNIFLAEWPWNLTDDLEKQQGTAAEHLQVFFASFHHHMSIQTGVTVWKRLSGVFSLWPRPLTSDLDLLHGHHFCHW